MVLSESESKGVDNEWTPIEGSVSTSGSVVETIVQIRRGYVVSTNENKYPGLV